MIRMYELRRADPKNAGALSIPVPTVINEAATASAKTTDAKTAGELNGQRATLHGDS